MRIIQSNWDRRIKLTWVNQSERSGLIVSPKNSQAADGYVVYQHWTEDRLEFRFFPYFTSVTFMQKIPLDERLIHAVFHSSAYIWQVTCIKIREKKKKDGDLTATVAKILLTTFVIIYNFSNSSEKKSKSLLCHCVKACGRCMAAWFLTFLQKKHWLSAMDKRHPE